VAASSSGLRVTDVSNPESPVELGALDTLGDAEDVEVVGDLAHVADGSSGLRTIDVFNPASPVELGALDTPGYAEDVAVVGDLAYVADGGSGLRAIDVSNPGFPVELGALDTPDDAVDVEVVGDLAYVADGSSGLRIIDVANPAFPVEIGSIAMPDYVYAYDVEVIGDLAYVASGEVFPPFPRFRPPRPRGSLRVIDVSDPVFPVELAALETERALYDVEVVGNLAYVAGDSQLRVIEVSNPAFPMELGALDMLGSNRDVEVGGDLVYVTNGRALYIIDFGPEYVSEILIDLDIKPGSDPNSINPDDGGVVPAAILGSDSFDVADVDATTLAFGPDGAAPAHSHGPHIEDVNGDGFADLLAHYPTVEAGIEFGTLVACVSGETLEGKPFNGCDAVRTVPDMDGDKLLDTEEATLGTNPLNRDSDGDGFTDGNEVLVLRSDPLNARDPKSAQTRQGRVGRRRR
jgi:hypothetical protein